MIFSRTMRAEDYDMLKPELEYLERVKQVCGWDSRQHHRRHWEYALALKAFKAWLDFRNNGPFPRKKELPIRISDHGCGIGLMGPTMAMMGCEVSLYDPWVYGDESAQATAQMNRALQAVGTYQAFFGYRRPLCELTDEDRNFDVSFCISTLEHIGEYQRAFRDLCSTVKPGGMIFLTTDFGEHEEDTYTNANLRAGRMFCQKTYEELMCIGCELGFRVFCSGERIDSPGHLSGDWPFTEEHRLVNDHGFASLCMVRS